MKVKNLIELLQKYDPELPVYIYTDHGQTSERVVDVYKGILDLDDIEQEVRCEDEYQDFEKESENLISVLEIYS